MRSVCPCVRDIVEETTLLRGERQLTIKACGAGGQSQGLHRVHHPAALIQGSQVSQQSSLLGLIQLVPHRTQRLPALKASFCKACTAIYVLQYNKR